MKRVARQHTLLLAALAMLSLRALTPAGYMPGSPGSGLLFELCPAGMPAGVMQALGGGHHHHAPAGSTMSDDEQCPIGHMLSGAVASADPLPVEVPRAKIDVVP
ncbi:MAG: hypothetical protein P8X94_10400, partial [Woeseiaceae bacterium]